jgi:hypothetical protein
VTAPLQLSFDVACSPEHAFATWTSRTATWWPRDHTVSGRGDAAVVIEPGVGGRIYERTAQGVEHDWGRVTRWEPPDHLGYLWHLGRAATDATEVDIRFLPAGPGSTRVEIEHRGWERLGDDAAIWRDRNRVGWESLIPFFAGAIEKGAS